MCDNYWAPYYYNQPYPLPPTTFTTTNAQQSTSVGATMVSFQNSDATSQGAPGSIVNTQSNNTIGDSVVIGTGQTDLATNANLVVSGTKTAGSSPVQIGSISNNASGAYTFTVSRQGSITGLTTNVTPTNNSTTTAAGSYNLYTTVYVSNPGSSLFTPTQLQTITTLNPGTTTTSPVTLTTTLANSLPVAAGSQLLVLFSPTRTSGTTTSANLNALVSATVTIA